MTNEIISEEIRQVTSEDASITYTLKRKNVKNLNLRIKPDASVIVSVPPAISTSDVDAFVIRKKNYISKTLSEIKCCSDESKFRQYISGEGYSLEGKNLSLKITASDRDFIETDGVFLILYVKNTEDSVKKSKLVKKFYEDVTKSVMRDILQNDLCRYFKLSAGRKDLFKFRNFTEICELIEYKADVNRQSAVIIIYRPVIQRIKKLSVHHSRKEVVSGIR